MGLLTPVGDSEALKRRAADFSPSSAADRYLDLLLPERGAREKTSAGGKV